MNDTNQVEIFNLSKVELPDGYQPQEWAERNGLGAGLMTWEEVCVAAGVTKSSPTQSAKVALDRAIKRAQAQPQSQPQQQGGDDVQAALTLLTNALRGSVNEEKVRAMVTDELSQHMDTFTGLLDTLSTDINNRIKSEVIGEEQLKQIVQDAIERVKPLKLIVGDTKEVDLTQEHYNFHKLLTLVTLRLNSWLAGPAGSGKTTAAHRVATALNLPYYAISVGLQTGKHEFFGYYDANGHYVRTLFRDAYEKGGVFLIDEIDAGSPHVLTSINSALANGICSFPDGMVNKHPDFILIACANTWGLGADSKYVGRLQIDGATLNRFVKLPWGYDEKIEKAMCCGNHDWLKFIRKVRANAEKYHINCIASPRDTYFGAQLLANGINLEDAKKMTVFSGVTDEQRKLLEGGN